MPEKLILEGTEDTPSVTLDRDSSKFSIRGRSYPENPREFYEPIATWLKEYGQSPNDVTSLEVELEYVNSGSVKEVFGLLFLVEAILESGKVAKIVWRYKRGDELMQQKGMEFSQFLDVPVELVEE